MDGTQLFSIPDLFPALTSLAGRDAPDPFALSLQAGLMVCSAVAAAVQLHVLDALEDEPQTIEELSRTTGTHAPSLFLLLRALAGIGISAEVDRETHRFVHTARSRALQTGAEGGMVDLVRLWSAEYQWDAWRHLSHTIRTGEPALAALYGKQATIWTHLHSHPHDAQVFQRGLAANTNLILPALLAAVDFSSITQLVDIGGGRGQVSRALLEHFPQMQITLFDLPQVIKQAREYAQELAPALAHRYTLVAGDFFADLPAGKECYLLKNVLMDWPDDDALRLLHRCRAAMDPEKGRLIIIEPVIGPDTPFTFFFSLQMAMMMHAARHRTLEEHQYLFAQAGFRFIGARPLGLETMLLEGVPLTAQKGASRA